MRWWRPNSTGAIGSDEQRGCRRRPQGRHPTRQPRGDRMIIDSHVHVLRRRREPVPLRRRRQAESAASVEYLNPLMDEAGVDRVIVQPRTYRGTTATSPTASSVSPTASLPSDWLTPSRPSTRPIGGASPRAASAACGWGLAERRISTTSTVRTARPCGSARRSWESPSESWAGASRRP